MTSTDFRVHPAAPRGLDDALHGLLTGADEEFVPPLSSRTGTLQSALGPATARAGIDAYLAAVLDQELLVAQDVDGVLGFLSYRPDHVVAVDGRRPIGPVAYVTTIVVAPTARGRGVGRALYRALLDGPAGRAVATRTWSGNASHLALLASLGFAEVIRLPDDRGPGLDTVYLLLEQGSR
ncbi:GNAT family N-acetyltransferase [Cellulomonas fengjieae]|uniref:GNAT family N-acetyltransferase n=1 Tax=Cellulomonas fengjieae TaxID=2819978 RepID=UPI001AAF07D1|nr:GNAT family N-acetyltransferase [Cellulomonas fengjieae]MBO3101914.1 GNAT family N-acetyltransferase [Cellulomonas fengjieae]